MANEVTIKMVCAPWPGVARSPHKLLVDLTYYQVRVWDDVAGYFTLRHSLTPASVRAALRKARKEAVV